MRNYYTKNKEKVQKIRKEYYLKNRDTIRRKQKEYSARKKLLVIEAERKAKEEMK